MIDKFQILQNIAENQRRGLIAQAKKLAFDMTESAQQIEKSAEDGNLARLVWVTRTFNPLLADQIETLRAHLHLLNGLAEAK